MPLTDSGRPLSHYLIPGSRPTKPRIFVSYHHDNDQWWYNHFSEQFCGIYDVAADRSLDRCIDSEDPEYVMRRIREERITGSSVTIVLCGAETARRKYVDWEIKATLDKGHGLLGLVVPGTVNLTLPWRLFDNYQSGYADFHYSWPQSPQDVGWLLQQAKLRAERKELIVNNRSLMSRNQ